MKNYSITSKNKNMQLINILTALSPIIFCALLIIVFKRTTLFAAFSAIILALLLVTFHSALNIDQEKLLLVIKGSLILTLSVAMVVIPGLYLNAVLRAKGIVRDLVLWIESLPLNSERKALLLLLGVLPALESLTGFGVSLFLGVPIFFHLFEEKKAYRLSMLGMNIMPWGTLAIATTIGASLSGYSVLQLGSKTALTSFFIFPLIGLIGLHVIGGTALLLKRGVIALFLGFGLSSLLYLFSSLNLVEIAGILSGVIVALLAYFLLRQKSALKNIAASTRENITKNPSQNSKNKISSALFPYALILLLILITRTVPPIHQFLAENLLLRSGKISYSFLTSPVIILAFVAIVIQLGRPVVIEYHTIAKRAKIAILSLFFFIVLAQIMNQSGMISLMTEALKESQHEVSWAVIFIAPLLAMVSGFITGSNLGGNALAMSVQQQIGANLDQGLLFSAIQNSGAGHAAFTSLPIIILIMTIAKDVGKKSNIAVGEHELLSFGLKSAALVYFILLIIFAYNANFIG